MSAVQVEAVCAMVETDVLVELSEAVWSSFIDTDTPLDGPLDVDPAGWTDQGVIGEVSIHGDFTGVLRVVLSPEGASQVAGRMFDVPAGSVDPDDLFDAVGEVANMLGGNVKALLVGGHSLGLPSVRILESPVAPPAADTVATATLAWGHQLVLVRLDRTTGGTP